MTQSDEVVIRERKVTDLYEGYCQELEWRMLALGGFRGREKSEGWYRVGGEQQWVGWARKEDS